MQFIVIMKHPDHSSESLTIFASSAQEAATAARATLPEYDPVQILKACTDWH